MRHRWSWYRPVIGAGAALVLAFAGAGCGGATPNTESLPADKVAREALEAALKMLRDGGSPGAVPGTDPTVNLIDTAWGRGDRLSSYEILGENIKATEMQFTVKLTLTKPDRVKEVQYYVAGRNPIFVFRDEDYMRNINMDGPPPNQKPAKSNRNQRR
jgi:hypothetical protein